MQISMLEAKSKQPGIKDHDLQPIGQEIYNSLDEYFILFYQYKVKPREIISKGKGSRNIENKYMKGSKKKVSVISTNSVIKMGLCG